MADRFADDLQPRSDLALSGPTLAKSDLRRLTDQCRGAAAAVFGPIGDGVLDRFGSGMADAIVTGRLGGTFGEVPGASDSLVKFQELASTPVVDLDFPILVDPTIDIGHRTNEVLYDVRAELEAYRRERQETRDDDRRRWHRYWWITGIIAFAAAGFGALVTVLLT